jgi:hypothetical protein
MLPLMPCINANGLANIKLAGRSRGVRHQQVLVFSRCDVAALGW